MVLSHGFRISPVANRLGTEVANLPPMYSSETVTQRGRFALRLPAGALGEQRLARMAARGEHRAFEAVFDRYHRELYGYCRAILGDPEEAQDALQNTMT